MAKTRPNPPSRILRAAANDDLIKSASGLIVPFRLLCGSGPASSVEQCPRWRWPIAEELLKHEKKRNNALKRHQKKL